jgi:hypothetical protein
MGTDSLEETELNNPDDSATDIKSNLMTSARLILAQFNLNYLVLTEATLYFVLGSVGNNSEPQLYLVHAQDIILDDGESRFQPFLK